MVTLTREDQKFALKQEARLNKRNFAASEAAELLKTFGGKRGETSIYVFNSKAAKTIEVALDYLISKVDVKIDYDLDEPWCWTYSIKAEVLKALKKKVKEA